jgi:hypothetical protein
VRFVVGFPGGSATDIVGRLIAQSLSERDYLGSNIAGRTWPIVDDNLLAKPTFRPYDARSNQQRASARS